MSRFSGNFASKLLMFNDKYILEGSRITGFDGNILSSSYLFSHRIMQCTSTVDGTRTVELYIKPPAAQPDIKLQPPLKL